MSKEVSNDEGERITPNRLPGLNLGCNHVPPCAGTKRDAEGSLQSFVIVETDRGLEVWANEAEDKLIAVFTDREDADLFVGVASKRPKPERSDNHREYWAHKQRESRARRKARDDYHAKESRSNEGGEP